MEQQVVELLQAAVEQQLDHSMHGSIGKYCSKVALAFFAYFFNILQNYPQPFFFYPSKPHIPQAIY